MNALVTCVLTLYISLVEIWNLDVVGMCPSNGNAFYRMRRAGL